MNIELMKTLCQMTEKQLFNAMLKYLKNHYTKVNFTEEYIIAYGNLPIILCGHLDTVYSESAHKEIYFDPIYNVMLSPQGIAGDDRCASYAIIQLIEEGYRPNIILFLHEEDGGSSAQFFIKMNKKSPFDNVKCIIELDRQGRDDIVFYHNDNKEFTNYMLRFGFKEEEGTFSDISVLMEPYSWCGCNISIGFENEHCYGSEVIHLDWVHETIEKVKRILDNSEDMLSYTYIPRESVQNFYWPPSSCLYCGKHILNKKGHNISGIDQYDGKYSYYLCDECFKREFEIEENIIDKNKKI